MKVDLDKLDSLTDEEFEDFKRMVLIEKARRFGVLVDDKLQHQIKLAKDTLN